jgi:hypothetical protein
MFVNIKSFSPVLIPPMIRIHFCVIRGMRSCAISGVGIRLPFHPKKKKTKIEQHEESVKSTWHFCRQQHLTSAFITPVSTLSWLQHLSVVTLANALHMAAHNPTLCIRLYLNFPPIKDQSHASLTRSSTHILFRSLVPLRCLRLSNDSVV